MRMKTTSKVNNRMMANEESSNLDLNGSTSSNGSQNGMDDIELDSADLSTLNQNCSSLSEADRKRAHHNALERKRRDHIKDSFHTLRDAIPNIKGEKTSRAQILKAATDYIKLIRNRNGGYQEDIDFLKKQNNDIENQIRQLEKAKQAANHYIKHEKLDHDQNDSNSYMEDQEDQAIVLSTKYEPSTSNENATSSTSNNNVLVLTKPLSSGLTSSTLQQLASSNTKKFKTIINPKNNLNIINISNSNTSFNNNNKNGEKDFF